ncbi:antibiotic biosynthesis monooxygenase [Croceicoccus sp. YJ47]|nr:antibiotic biosynthesis monooxygenase [Croceicoccus sp. YJ47]
MAYSFLSRFRIKETRVSDFLDAARQMEQQAREEEGALFFQFYRLDLPGMFAVLESFVDEKAGEAHMEYERNKPLIATMIDCMDGSYEREMLLDLESAS